MKLSEHSKKRIKERANVYDKAGQKDLFRNALIKGKSIGEMNDCPTKEWLLNHIPYKNKGKIKVYKNYVFIYSKNSHRLYTMYKLPEELIK